MIQVHRQLKQQGYTLQLGGIDYLRPGTRYVGVTYSDEMREFLRLQVVGDLAWDAVLSASNRLEPKFIYQFLPQDNYFDNWYLAFKTPSGLYGFKEAIGAGYMKELMKALRRDTQFGEVFTNSITYAQPSGYRFQYNSLCELELEGSRTGFGFQFKGGVDYTQPRMSWDTYIVDLHPGCIAYSDPIKTYPTYGDRYGSYNNLKPPVIEEAWPTQFPRTEAERNSVMAKVIAEKEAVQAQAAQAQQEAQMRGMTEARWQILPNPGLSYGAAGTIAPGWEPLKWYDDNAAEIANAMPKLPSISAPVPAKAQEPVVKAKYGRLIQFAKEGE